MLPLSEIRPYYPEELHRFPRFMLREYLQYKILEIVYESPFATDLCFLGGTCLRIVHGNRRFSEGLDFDNISLEEGAFKEVAGEIQKGLEQEGYKVELKMIQGDIPTTTSESDILILNCKRGRSSTRYVGDS